MDFQYFYTEEQQQFRGDVVAWLDSNIPTELELQGEAATLEHSLWEKGTSLRRKLGLKGWLAPTEPVERGGGGLTPDHALVLLEELGKRNFRMLLEGGVVALRSALHYAGTEKQKDAYLSTMAQGESDLWYPALEHGSKLDLGNIGIKASLQGDDFILTGTDTFAGYSLRPDYLWVFAVTNPDDTPQWSTATFLIPSGLHGIETHSADSLVQGELHAVTFKEVSVPSSCLLGEEGDGWPLLHSTLLSLPLPDYPLDGDSHVDDLIRYACKNSRYGESLSRQPFFQQLLMEVYINSQLIRILKIRNSWMATTRQQITYQTAQVALLEKHASQRLAQVTRDIMGIYALLGPSDPRAPLGGNPQFQQKQSVALQNLTGGPEVNAGDIAKHLGLGEPVGEISKDDAVERPTDKSLAR